MDYAVWMKECVILYKYVVASSQVQLISIAEIWGPDDLCMTFLYVEYSKHVFLFP